MKKFAKMSLVAAIAVAGTTASAQPLAEAIKNVDVSGTVAYRYNDYELNNSNNNYKIAINTKSKVNDDILFNSRVIIGANSDDDVNGSNANSNVSLNTRSNPDANPMVTLSEANFTYTGVENLIVTFGKQGIATPFTVHRDSMGSESTGTGILAAYNLGPVTFAGAYFNQTNISYQGATALNGTNVAALAIIGSFAGVNADAWYLDVADTLDAYTIGLNASYEVSGISLNPSLRYSEIDYDNKTSANDDVSTFKASIGASLGMFNAYLAYAESGKDGGVSIDGLSSAVVADDHWNVWLYEQADSEIIFANIGAQVTDKLALSVHYSDLEDNVNNNSDVSELYGQVKYIMSKNLSTYVRFGQIDDETETEKETAGRLQVQYSF